MKTSFPDDLADNEYERQRAERIKRNQALLTQLQVSETVLPATGSLMLQLFEVGCSVVRGL